VISSILVNQVTSLARPVRQGSVGGTDMQKSQIESKTKRTKAEALDKASEAIGVLRELGIGNDTILKDLGFQRPRGSHRGQTKKKPLTAEELEQKKVRCD
jgi:hypothetical protein